MCRHVGGRRGGYPRAAGARDRFSVQGAYALVYALSRKFKEQVGRLKAGSDLVSPACSEVWQYAINVFLRLLRDAALRCTYSKRNVLWQVD